MFDRIGIDLSMIQSAVGPTACVLAASRKVGLPIIYLKMGFRTDLSDAGPVDAPNRMKHAPFAVGTVVRAPDGTESRILIRDRH
jgi:ureidoacrylate peracid hydrolase